MLNTSMSFLGMPQIPGCPDCARGGSCAACGGLGDATVSETQKRLHVTAETVAVFGVAPFMFWLATQRKLPLWSRYMSSGIGLATVLVDGYLLMQFLRK